jgi:SAM-dependent methyltransferase
VTTAFETKNCPLCRNEMLFTGEAYTMDEVFRLWKADGVSFSRKVINEHSKEPETKLFACKHCRLEMFFPAITGSPVFYEELQEAVDWYYSEHKRWEFTRALKDIRALKARNKCRTLLEVGCGDGKFLSMAAEACHFDVIIGAEVNPAAVGKARARGFTIHSGPLSDLRARYPEGFDVICAFQVLEHVDDPVGFLTSLRELAAPTGSLIFGVPNQAGPIQDIKPYLHDLPPHHVTRWRGDTFLRGVSPLGLSVQYMRAEPLARYHFSWLLPVYLRRIVGQHLSRALMPIVSFTDRCLYKLRVKRLPFVHGHTLYVRLLSLTQVLR